MKVSKEEANRPNWLVSPKKWFATIPLPSKDFTIILIAACLFGGITFYSTNYTKFVGIDVESTAKTIGIVLGLSAIWLSYKRVLSTYYLTIDTFQQKERHQEEVISLQKKKAAIDIITEWYKDLADESLSVRDFLSQHKDKRTGKTSKLVIQKMIESPEEKDLPIRKEVILILNYLEKICIALEYDVISEKVVKAYFYDIFLLYIDAFESLINIRQEEKQSNSPHVWEYFEKYALRWRNEKSVANLGK